MPQPKKRTITVMEEGRVVYEGEDKRYYNSDYGQSPYMTPKIFNLFSVKEVVQAAIFIFMISLFLMKLDERQTSQEKSILYLMEFSVNSDGWQSTVYGTQFKGGKPLNDAYVEKLIEGNLKKRKGDL